MVIWRLLDNPLRYSEMAQRLPEITERVLSQVLKELEHDGIVERSEQRNWQLTALGQALKDRKSTRLNSSHSQQSRMPSSA